MKLIHASIHQPHAVIVVVLLGVLFGYLTLIELPLQLKPSLDKPEIKIDTAFRGASPFEVEDQITTPIEEKMDNVEGVKKIISSSAEGRSSITLEFDWGVHKDKVLIDVINKLSQVANLPEDAEQPVVTSVSSDETEPIMWIVIASKNRTPNQLFEIGEDILEPQIRRVPGVGDLLMFGGEEQEMHIRLSYQEMVAKKITIGDLLSSLRRENINVRGGFIDEGKRRYTLRTLGQFSSIRDIEEMIVARTPQGSVYLKEIAKVSFGYKKSLSAVRASGQPTLAIGVLRKSGSNVVQICRDLEKRVAELNKEFLEKNMDAQLVIVYQDVSYIDQAIQLAKGNLIEGAILAILVLLVFLRSLRATFIVALAIPLCLIMVFIFLYFFKRTLNIISLAGLAFSSGMIVDNSIVVIENIYRHLGFNSDPKSASYNATSEVWGAVLISTLTTLCVFIPIIFIEDEAGQLFKDIAIAISISISLSLILSVTLVPMLCSLLLKGRTVPSVSSTEKKESKILLFLKKGKNLLWGFLNLSWFAWIGFKLYEWTLYALIGTRWWKILLKISVILGVCAFFFYSLKYLPNAEYLPSGNRNLILIFAKPLVGNNLEKNIESIRPLEEIVKKDPRVERFFTIFGDRFNAVGVATKPEFSDEINMKKFNGEMFGITRKIAGFESLFPTQASIFRNPGKQFELDIIGPSLENIAELSKKIQGQLFQTKGVLFVRSSYSSGNPEVQIKLDRIRCASLGLRVSEIADLIESMVAGKISGVYNHKGKQIDLTLYSEKNLIDTRQDLERIQLYTPSGKLVRLSDVTDIQTKTGPTAINHVEKERSITLTINLTPEIPLEEAIQIIEQQVLAPQRALLPSSYSLRLGGTADKLNTTITSLRNSFILAIIIVYLLMVALFGSFIYPFIIMLTIPMAMTGSFIGISLAHHLSEGRIIFDVIAMLGLIILSGIVINNAILIIHQTLNLKNEGKNIEDALFEASLTRLRPILMSVTTSVLGMFPLALGQGSGAELYRGLGAVLLGGLILSTVFTLFFIPALFSFLQDIKKALHAFLRLITSPFKKA
jgi:HAE1 family hydrophobic/amphiphilic exporter-1